MTLIFKILQPPEEKEALLTTDEYQEQMSESSFLFLTLDLPTAPLYKDEKEQLIIPQVPLFNILAKFNGSTEKVPIHFNPTGFDNHSHKVKELANTAMSISQWSDLYYWWLCSNIK